MKNALLLMSSSVDWTWPRKQSMVLKIHLLKLKCREKGMDKKKKNAVHLSVGPYWCWCEAWFLRMTHQVPLHLPLQSQICFSCPHTRALGIDGLSIPFLIWPLVFSLSQISITLLPLPYCCLHCTRKVLHTY